MPHEMPANRGWQRRNLCSRFLDATFAEQRLPGLVCLAHLLGRMSFGNRDQLYLINCATDFRGSLRDLLTHTRKIFSNRIHAVVKALVPNAYLQISVLGT